MKHSYVIAFGLLALTGSAYAQFRITAQDSTALFITEEDQFTRSRELLRAKGHVTDVTARPDGGVDLAVLRQHIGYLKTDKTSGLRSGVTTLPALLTTSFRNGRLQPPTEPISGKKVYQLYVDHTLPFLTQSGGEILFMGESKAYLIGPASEHWDVVLLIKQNSVDSFLAFESNQDYLKGIGHRTAALEDSRLLPIVETINEPSR